VLETYGLAHSRLVELLDVPLLDASMDGPYAAVEGA